MLSIHRDNLIIIWLLMEIKVLEKARLLILSHLLIIISKIFTLHKRALVKIILIKMD